MSTLDEVLRKAIEPALALLPPKMNSPQALVELLSIALQESRCIYRCQKTTDPYTKGPARGLWEMERAGAFGVMTHRASGDIARAVCAARNVPFDSVLVHARLEFDDVLAAALARLLLFTDPKPLPALDAPAEEGWQCYVRNWRPGKPRRETWDAFHGQALTQVIMPAGRSAP